MTNITQRIEAQTSIPHIVLTAVARKGLTALATVLATRGVISGDQTEAFISISVGMVLWAADFTIGQIKARSLRALALDPATTTVVAK